MPMETKKAKIIAELERHGNASRACKRASVPRRTFYAWRESDSYFSELVKNAVKRSND